LARPVFGSDNLTCVPLPLLVWVRLKSVRKRRLWQTRCWRAPPLPAIRRPRLPRIWRLQSAAMARNSPRFHSGTSRTVSCRSPLLAAVPPSCHSPATTFLPLPSHCLGHSINKTYTKVAEARPGLRQANEWRLRAGSGRIPRDRVAHVCREWSASRWGPSAHPTTQDASGEVGPDWVTKPFWLSWAPGGARA